MCMAVHSIVSNTYPPAMIGHVPIRKNPWREIRITGPVAVQRMVL